MNMELSDKFEQLGLTKYQAAALAAIVGESRLPVKKIAERAGIPITKAYGTLNELELMRTVRSERTRPKKYFTENSKRVVATILEAHKRQLKEAEDRAEEALTIIRFSGFNGNANRKSYLENSGTVGGLRTANTFKPQAPHLKACAALF